MLTFCNLNKLQVVLPLFLLAIATSCIPQRKFQEMELRAVTCDSLKNLCQNDLEKIRYADSVNNVQLNYLKVAVDRLRMDSAETKISYDKQKLLNRDLNDAYEKLLKVRAEEGARSDEQIRELERKVLARQKENETSEARLQALKDETEKLKNQANSRIQAAELAEQQLKASQARVDELSRILTSKDSSVNALKNMVQNAMLGFKDAGLEVEIRNGKVYVSLSEQLLFASGSIKVDPKGREAILKLAETLQKEKDISILVEGHTDDVPLKPQNDHFQDNWDLSVLRANSIVRILTKEGKIDPKRLMAAGRGEHFPIEKSKTKEARQKNRRTEIILTPKLDELLKALETN